MTMTSPAFLTRVVLKNYKSIAECSVDLGPLTFLVGPNGAGKSNFLDALRLVRESLHGSLEGSLRERGGVGEVRRRSKGTTGRPTHFRIHLEFDLGDAISGHYAFRIGALPKGGFEVQREECRICSEKNAFDQHFYTAESGKVKETSARVMPPASPDRLLLVAAAGLAEFRPLYDALSRMGFYNLNPEEIRDLQPPDTGEVLQRDGRNLASVLNALGRDNPDARNRVVEFLSKVVPGIEDVTIRHVGKKEMLEFHQRAHADSGTLTFPAENMSDGTLRALGVLTALFQSTNGGAKRVPLVGIEEPEMAVHPGAAGVLRDALCMAANWTQVIVTSHSPDLLDDKDVQEDWVLAVVNEDGETKIGPLNGADRTLMRDRLFTAGELLRQGTLTPDLTVGQQIPPEQPGLFAEPDA
jgi:predicted ATPase